MCNNYARYRAYYEYAKTMAELSMPIVSPGPERAPNLPPQYDIRPTEYAPIFRRLGEGVEMVDARWWLVPRFHTGPLKAFRRTTFNARSEEIGETQSFRQSFRDRRCLIPADAWFEFTGEGRIKERWRIAPRDGEWMCIAGLWDRAETSDAGTVDSFAMVMRPANDRLNPMNDRAPVILPRKDWATWLNLEADVGPLMAGETPDLYDFEKAPSRAAVKAEQGALI